MSTLLGGAGGKSNSKNLPVYTGLQVQTSALNVPIPIGWGRNRITFNLIWQNDFTRHSHGQGGKGGGGGKAGNNYTYTVACILALGWGEISSVPTVYTNQSKTTLGALGFTLYNGTAVQTPVPYIVAKHPSEALSYPNIAYIENSNLDLGSSPNLPSIDVEAVMNLSGTMPGTPDVNLADVIPDFLTNPLYGMGLVSGNIGASIADFATYTRAQGLFFSPVLTSQEKATQVLNRWAQVTNTWIFWSGNEIKFVPLGDKAITANGVTYTPNNTVQYSLTALDFLEKKGPVSVSRVDPSDAYNLTRVQINDRALDYNSNPIEYTDQTLLDKFGLKDTSVTATEITDAAIGLTVATLIGKRNAYLRNTYSFRTDHRYCRLEPGDLITLTDPSLPYVTNLPVRIVSVECDENSDLAFTAEDYPGNVGNFTPHVMEVASPTLFDRLIAPGDVNPPMIFEPNAALAAPPQLWVAASGGANYGGCDVWISFDGGVEYNTLIGTLTAPAKQGVLTATLANHADPDAVDTLSVDLTQSQGQLNPVSHADADAFRSLSYLVPEPVAHVINPAGELIAYGAVASTGTYTDNLTYLRRALYGTAAASHASGNQFTLLDLAGTDGSLLRYTLPVQYIGSTIYVKFLAFNIYGQSKQTLADVTAYTYTTFGTGYGGGTLGVPTTPTGLAVSAGADTNTASWNANPPTDNVQYYKLYRANGTGASFGAASVIWAGQATSHADVNIASGAAYTYFLTAVNAAGESLPTAGVNATSSAFAARPLRISAGTPGRKPDDGEYLFNIEMKTGDALPANLVGSELGIDTNNGGVAPASTFTVTIKKNSALIFTGTIAASGTTGTFSVGGAVTFVDGDFLSARLISPQDATCQGVTLTLIGTRTQ